jgi:carboxyl-terminal processing protease
MNRFRPAAVVVLALGAIAPPVAARQVVAVQAPRFSSELALLTFDSAWSRINTTHYDSTFSGVDWSAVRRELRPRAAAAESIDDLRRVIRDMLERLGESHYTLIPEDVADAVDPSRAAAGPDSRLPGDAGLELRLADNRLVAWRVEPGGPADLAGVKPGWVVHSIDDFQADDALTQLGDREAPAARPLLTRFLYGVNARLDGPAGSSLEIGFEEARGDRPTRRLVRRPRPGQPVRFGELPTFYARLDHERLQNQGGCVGLIRFNVWMVPLVREFDRAVDDLRDCEGIIIDLRGNPGGVAGMVMGVAGHFLDKPETLGTMRSRGSTLNFVANPRRVDTAAKPVEPFAGPLALLIDPMSVSTTEIFAAGLQALGRARVFGENSAGQALPAATLRLPDGDVLMHVVADFTAGNGVRIEGRGVIPDVEIPLTRGPLLAGHDTVLDAAVAWIRGGKRARP